MPMEREDIVLRQLGEAVLNYLRTFSPEYVVPAEECAGANDSDADASDVLDPLDIPVLESSHGFFLGIDTRRRAIRDITSVFDRVKAAVYSAFLEAGVEFTEVQLREPGDYSQLPHSSLNDAMLVEVEKEAFDSIFHPAVARSGNAEGIYPRILIFNGFPTQDEGLEKWLRARLCGRTSRRGFRLEEMLGWKCEQYRHINTLLQVFEDPNYTAGEKPLEFDSLVRSLGQQAALEFSPAKTQADPWDYRDMMFIIIDYHQDGDNRGSVLTNSPFSVTRIVYQSTPIDFCFFI